MYDEEGKSVRQPINWADYISVPVALIPDGNGFLLARAIDKFCNSSTTRLYRGLTSLVKSINNKEKKAGLR